MVGLHHIALHPTLRPDVSPMLKDVQHYNLRESLA